MDQNTDHGVDQTADATALERGTTFTPRYGPDGLLPAMAVHADTSAPLMLAWMNAAAVQKTLETGEAHYWSRRRRALWRKGATSGQVQKVVEVRVDCDQDALVLRVRPGGDGGCCHVGYPSCFYRVVDGDGVLRIDP